jgi:hypothetical protein
LRFQAVSLAEIISAHPLILTDAQSQGTKVASTVARGGKTEGIAGLSTKSLKSYENPKFSGKPF